MEPLCVQPHSNTGVILEAFMGLILPSPGKPLQPYRLMNRVCCRLSLAGALFTQNAHAHWNEGDGGCKWCGLPDSLYHRYYECCNTLDLRTKHAPDVVANLGFIPNAMALRSWALLPPTHLLWLRLLDSIPRAVPSLAGKFRVGVVNEVFTDGSCLWQADPSLRLTSWGAVLAGRYTPDWSFQHGGILGAGPVPGLCQTAYRGELFALAFVLHHAALSGSRVKIYCDCLGVVNRYHLLTQGTVTLKSTAASADLWTWVLESLDRLGAGMVEVVKVPAHRRLTQAKTRREAWSIWHNNVVDNVAKAANLGSYNRFLGSVETACADDSSGTHTAQADLCPTCCRGEAKRPSRSCNFFG